MIISAIAQHMFAQLLLRSLIQNSRRILLRCWRVFLYDLPILWCRTELQSETPLSLNHNYGYRNLQNVTNIAFPMSHKPYGMNAVMQSLSGISFCSSRIERKSRMEVLLDDSFDSPDFRKNWRRASHIDITKPLFLKKNDCVASHTATQTLYAKS